MTNQTRKTQVNTVVIRPNHREAAKSAKVSKKFRYPSETELFDKKSTRMIPVSTNIFVKTYGSANYIEAFGTIF